MSDKLDETIKVIAVRHGVVLSRDDPILILQTMHEKLLEESLKAQQNMLAHFREEIGNISSQWKDNAMGKAENILNAALVASKEAMTKLLQESTRESVQTMKKMVSDSLAETHNLTRHARKSSLLAFLSSIAILGGLSLSVLFFWFIP